MARPEIQYARTSDGVSIACYAMGEGPPLVLACTADFASHLRMRFMPEYHRDGHGLGRFNRIVRFDGRGSGGPVAIAYAAGHPDRVDHLVLFQA